MDDELSNLITLTNEEGNDEIFEFLDLIEYRGEEYLVLLPKGGDEVVILHCEKTENIDLESYVGVGDEETLNAVFEIFKVKFKDEFNFLDA